MVRWFRSRKRKENKRKEKKRKEKSTLKYTMSPSPLPVVGIEDESYFTILKKSCHARIPDPTRMADPNRVRGARLCIGTLIDLLFFRAELVPVGIQQFM